jgi:hypothetical protein
MENPACWTPLHHQVFAACLFKESLERRAERITKVLAEQNITVSCDQIKSILVVANVNMSLGYVGASLPHQIVTYLEQNKLT